MMTDKNELYKVLKNMTLEEIISMFDSSSKTEGINNLEFMEKDDSKILYTIDELIEKYPFFTRYNINQAIQKGGLPFCTIGNKRLFSKEEVDKWLEKETKPKKVKYDI